MAQVQASEVCVKFIKMTSREKMFPKSMLVGKIAQNFAELVNELYRTQVLCIT